MSDLRAPAVPAEAIETGAAPPSDVPSPVVLEDRGQQSRRWRTVRNCQGRADPVLSGSATLNHQLLSLCLRVLQRLTKELASAAPLPTGSEPPTGSSQARKGANRRRLSSALVESLARLARTHRDARGWWHRSVGDPAPLGHARGASVGRIRLA